MQTDVFLILHGTGGNRSDHWQEYLARELREHGKDVHYPQMPQPTEPQLGPWMTMLRETLAGIPPDANLTVLTHSRGCTLWFHHAAAAAMDNFSGPQAARVLLVAPPYRVHENDPSGFYPAPLNPVGLAAAGRNTAIIASDDDEFTTYEEAAAYAAALSIPIFKLSGAGHISPMFGYGNWPWILNWCLGSADLPPEPKS